MISVIVPTTRVGGLDILTQSLARQTCRDFELVLADAIHAYRAPLVAERMAELPFPVQHLAPSGGVALSDYSRSINDALVAAKGDVVLILPDYSWLPANAIEIHATFHDEHRGQRKVLASGYTYLTLPPLHSAFPGYHPERQQSYAPLDLVGRGDGYERAITAEAERYEADLRSGRLDPVMWSLFAEPFTSESLADLGVESTHRLFDCEFSWRYCSLKNESYPIEFWEELNGLDEDLDGSHLYQDQALGYRLNDAGWTYERMKGGELLIPNPRSVFAAKRVLRRMAENAVEYERKRATGAAVNPGWSLRERREERHG